MERRKIRSVVIKRERGEKEDKNQAIHILDNVEVE
jgi:hypothetical protein